MIFPELAIDMGLQATSFEESQMADKKKKFSNSQEEYNDALATADPTKDDNNDLESLAKEAIKKFKSLS